LRAGWERGKIWVTGLGLRVGGGDWVSVLAGIGGGRGAEMGWGEGWRVVVDVWRRESRWVDGIEGLVIRRKGKKGRISG